jgi:hypothetical protein
MATVMLEESLHDDMADFRHADRHRRMLTRYTGRDAQTRRTRGIHQSLSVFLFAARQDQRPDTTLRPCAFASRAGPDRGTLVGGCVSRPQHREARVIGRVVGSLKTSTEIVLDRFARSLVLQIHQPGRRQHMAPAKVIMYEQAGPRHPSRAAAGAIRQSERQRPDDVWRGS